MSQEYPLLLVDASGYLFRAYHALPKLTNSRGEPTGALVGVLNMLRKLIEDQRPDYIGVVFDAGGRGFRHERYPDYKANRPAPPEDLRAQIEPLQTIIRALGLPLLVVPGVEADDVIGTLSTQAAALGLPTLISTGDKDLAQLVDEHVTLVNTMTGTWLDPAGVREKFGVPPERIVDYLALMGDSVDNIPGVPGCGPKTAAKWLTDYGDLDGVIAQAASIKGKIGESLRTALDQLPLARELLTIKRDVALDFGPTDLRPTPPDIATLRAWYERLELRRLLATLDGMGVAGAPPTQRHQTGHEPQYELVLTESALEAWLARLRTAELIALDTETTALDARRAELVGISFAVAPGQAAYVPLAHTYPGAPQQLDRDLVLARLKPVLEDPDRPKVGQNLKYDLTVLARYGIELHGIAHDTLIASYVLDSTARHDLDSLAKRFLGHDTIRFKDVAGTGSKQIRFDQVPLEQAGPYAAEDAEVTLRLHQVLQPRLTAVPKLERLYREIEMPLVPVLARLERAGVLIDAEQLESQSAELARRILELEETAQRVAGRRFNLGSPKQIAALLFEELGLPVVAKTPKGAPSTSEEVLEQLAQVHELPRIILEHRLLSKLKSTYTDKLPRLIDPATGRIHTSYHQTVTATGRLSSSDPNLQNIPIRTEEGRRIRRAFIAAPGHRLLAADYSQIELRIMAHLSGDARLLAAFAAGLDIHRATAAEILGLAPEAVTSEQRRSAKAINFGLIYGMSAFGLAHQLGIERAAAQAYVERYFERYPGVREFMERIRHQARECGYVETLFGRRLHLPEIGHSNQTRRAAAERTAINAPMQGTAADIIKRAMIAVDVWIETTGAPARLILQVHDELVLEVAETALEETREAVRAAMEGAAELAVPLVVEIGSGANWDDAH
ncbi:DNA polymerase I [Thermochromatium tepidum]|uniref:DNA polymerase I n=1 Tax=Thermochromatium tepidum ATCC 43061 TaxID=316276 RepID=A0A6I6ELT8_THETI|nr:DNA polymerase I [Thermochromatium tepidum]QGU33957.1 DNA polymerase I [Thermochromatium tepidum ATCC 43061]